MNNPSINKNSVCCVIVTYNIGKRFWGCFNAINGQTEKIVIVDNGSDAETISVLKEMEKNHHVHVIYNGDNLGIAAALNRGVEYALQNNFEWVLTMDNDSKATPDMVESMLKAYNNLEDHLKTSVVSLFPGYLEESFGERESAESRAAASGSGYDFVLNQITSGNLVRSSVFREVGFYLEKLFIDYVDVEFCLRLSSKGYKHIQFKDIFLVHNLGEPKKSRFLWRFVTYTNHSFLRRYYITRNRFYVWSRYFRTYPRFVLIDISFFLKELIKIVCFEENRGRKIRMIFRGIGDFITNKYGKLK